MLPAAKKSGIGLLLLALTVSTAAAASLDVRDGEVWLNQVDQQKVELTYDCGANASIVNLTLAGTEIGVSGDNGSVTTAEIPSGLKESSGKQLVLRCQGSGSVFNRTAELDLRYLDVSTSGGEGFVGTVLGKRRFTSAPTVTFNDSSDGVDRVQSNTRFEPGSDLEIVTEGVQSWKNENSQTVVRIFTRVEEGYPVQRDRSVFRFEHRGQWFKIPFSMNIHPWRADILEGPSSKLEYKNLQERYVYELDVEYDGTDSSKTGNSLGADNFYLTIEKKNEDGVYEPFHSNGKTYSKLDGGDWFDVSVPKGAANYRISLSKTPDLPLGKYRFKLGVKYDGGSFLVDQIKVDRALELSGRVTDGQKSGVLTEFTLRQSDGGQISFRTDNSGFYSQERHQASFDISSAVMDFFYNRPGRDARVKVGNPDFTGESTGGEAVRFQYWGSPNVNIRGVKPANMMAVKFAYHIKGGAKARMKFDTGELNPSKLKVYECTNWNFDSGFCRADWSKVNPNRVSINYRQDTVQVRNLELHHVPANLTGGEAKNLLLNAYVVGKNQAMKLENGIAISGPENGRAPVGKQIKVSGRLLSENGKPVESANVTVKFLDSLGVVETFSGTTDASGQFSISGEAPENPGNFTVAVEAEHRIFQDFSVNYANRFETYVKESVSIQLPPEISSTGFAIAEGEKRSFDFKVKNTGQREAEILSVEAKGMNEDFLTLKGESMGTLKPGESSSATVSIDLPRSYCGSCSDWPSFEIVVNARSNGESLKTSEKVQTQVSAASASTGNSSQSSTSGVSENRSGGGMKFNTPDLAEATGEFLASQSSVNIALALIMLFTMVLAGAVKKNRDGGSDRRMRSGRMGDGSRPSVQKPELSSDDDDEVDSKIEEMADRMKQDQVDELAESVKESEEVEEEDREGETGDGSDSSGEKGEENSSTECSVCGEEFDTETARKLHEQAIHDQA
ncbi:MAG: hypothetical protein ABEJ98_02190 [Candidatus Nanohaloarchaea archaeon]